MTAVDRDPVALAREVLDLTHEDETVTVCSVPDNKVAALARAVIRMDELADRLDPKNDWAPEWCREAAAEIRTALNGETDG